MVFDHFSFVIETLSRLFLYFWYLNANYLFIYTESA